MNTELPAQRHGRRPRHQHQKFELYSVTGEVFAAKPPSTVPPAPDSYPATEEPGPSPRPCREGWRWRPGVRGGVRMLLLLAGRAAGPVGARAGPSSSRHIRHARPIRPSRPSRAAVRFSGCYNVMALSGRTPLPLTADRAAGPPRTPAVMLLRPLMLAGLPTPAGGRRIISDTLETGLRCCGRRGGAAPRCSGRRPLRRGGSGGCLRR
jgi:hypothetical protein